MRNSTPGRTAILLSCSKEQAAAIREKAASQGRTVSACVLRTVVRWMDMEDRLTFATEGNKSRMSPLVNRRSSGTRTTILIRCSHEESRRIRAGAKRRSTTISGFIVHVLTVSWSTNPGLFHV